MGPFSPPYFCICTDLRLPRASVRLGSDCWLACRSKGLGHLAEGVGTTRSFEGHWGPLSGGSRVLPPVEATVTDVQLQMWAFRSPPVRAWVE